ncbi:MAG: RNA polymerase subunit sigma [Verrucomicrobia bacterium]|nr:MAG: RNA polymerase subunit sigma [Verrucomicrobiota bacterium]
MIYAFALKTGLTDTEADEVVQETAIAVARNLPEFKYDPKVCAFKTWLLNLTTWRIKDQMRRRAKAGAPASTPPKRVPEVHSSAADETSRTATIERVANPASANWDAVWDKEWETILWEAALEKVKDQANLKQYQIFDLYVLKQWPVREVARTLGVSVGRVYLAKHRISGLLKQEISRLEKTMT